MLQKKRFTHASIMRCRARDCPMCARSHALYVPWRRRAQSMCVEFYLYPTVGTVLIHSVKPELTE